MPDAEKRRVLERFGRGSSAAGVAGSGLGLAIVTSVVEAHGADLCLLDRPGGGLIARIDFPEAGGGTTTAGGGAARALLPLLVLVALLGAPWMQAAQAAQLLTYPAPGGERERLRIHSATDRQAIEPLVLDFQQLRPDVTIEYKDMDTADLYAEAVAAPAKGRRPMV